MENVNEGNKIIAGNKAIAEFMEVIYHPPTRIEDYYYMGGYKEWEYPNGTFYQTDDLQYHTSWDWLHPAWTKCYFKLVEINTSGCWSYINDMKQAMVTGDLTRAWEILVSSIEFINE